MRILITGGAGFIGAHLARHLVQKGHRVLVADDFSSGHWTNLVDFPGDVTTLDVAAGLAPVLALGQQDVIFHQASITDTTVMDQHRMMHNNVEGFRNILAAAREWGSRVVWASSAATYGRLPAPNAETQPPAPLNVYGYSKLAMERLAELYQPLLRGPVIGLRYFNVYGPGEVHKGKFANMVTQLALQMAQGKRPRIFTDGTQRRDFVYIDDVIQANLCAMEAQETGSFNVGSGGSATFNELVAKLNRALKTNLEPDYIDNPYAFFQTHTEADLTRSRKGLGYQPKHDLRKGIEAYTETGRLGVGI